MTYRVNYNFQVGEKVGSEIGAEHFGTNYLFHHDRVNADSTFPDIMDRVGIDLIRYPGGTVTEEFFDISNPTATVQSSLFGRPDRDVTPIQEFLEYVGQSGSEAIIVLPTYRYFDTTTREIDPAAETEIKAFVRAVLAGDYGNAEIKGFEIGNEWYQDKFDWNAAEFGELQSKIALWIDEVVQENGEWSDVDVYAQAGRGDDDHNGIEDDQEIAAQFNEAELDAIDGLISHFYASTSSGNPLILGGNVNRRLNDLADYWDVTDETGLDLVVTEWNVGGNGEDDTSVSGLMRNVALLNVFSNMMERGVDTSAIWTAQAPGAASLGTIEGDDHLTSTGYLYRMMRRELVDTQAVETAQDDEIYDQNGNEIGRTYIFQGNDKTVIYLASGINDDIDLTVNLGAFTTEDSHIHATVLGAAEGFQADDYRIEASTTTISNREFDNSGNQIFNLKEYEVIQVVITTGTGVKMFGDDQNATDDTFDGTAYGDEIWGLDGNDEIAGFAGDDHLHGGAGNDVIDGGQGNDVITTGAGSDAVDGGTGEDTLDYSGNQSGVRIYAREGMVEEDETGEVDSFAGIEKFIGTDYADTVFTDHATTSVDSGSGDDFIRVLGGENVAVRAGEGDDFVLAEFGETTVELGAGNDRFLSYTAEVSVEGGEGDDVIHGGDQNDTINGGEGNDVLSGGGGRDVFVFNRDEGTDVVLDFDASQDSLDLTDFDVAFDDIDVVSTADGVELEVGGETIVLLQSVAAEDVTSDVFSL